MSNLEIAKEYFYDKKYEEACELFACDNRFYEAGFCLLLLNKIDVARNYFKHDEFSFDCAWGLNCLEFIEKRQGKTRVSYLQIRAFFEIYVSYLIECKLFDYAENLLNMYQYLAQFNPEIYKFCARVLYSYNYFESALFFIEKTRELYFKDPEALFIAAQIACENNDFKLANEMINLTLEACPAYFPALHLASEIKNKI